MVRMARLMPQLFVCPYPDEYVPNRSPAILVYVRLDSSPLGEFLYINLDGDDSNTVWSPLVNTMGILAMVKVKKYTFSVGKIYQLRLLLVFIWPNQPRYIPTVYRLFRSQTFKYKLNDIQKIRWIVCWLQSDICVHLKTFDEFIKSFFSLRQRYMYCIL